MREIPILRMVSKPSGYRPQRCSRAIRVFSSFGERLGVTNNLLKYQNSDDADRIKLLVDPSVIPVHMVHESLSYLPGSLALAMTLRGQVLSILHDKGSNAKRKAETVINEKEAADDASHDHHVTRKNLVEMDVQLKKWLLAVFSPDMLRIEEITIEKSSASTLEKIVTGDAVGTVSAKEDLRNRLSNSSRYGTLLELVLGQVISSAADNWSNSVRSP
jgi:hypothetical protein